MEKSEIKGFIAKRCAKELKNGDEIILGKFRLVYFTNKAVIA